ncbi:MAG: VWA domain-containing protein [Silvibacterium sp.]
MFSRSFAAVCALSCLLTASPALLRAQANSGTTQQPAYTLQAGTRVVLTDVTVTDRNGNPIPGLKASDFQIFDNNKPQVLASFEAHTTTPVESLPQQSTAPGVYSNAFLQHLPPVLNVIVIDITNINIPDQMYLNYQLTRFFRQLPPGQPVAVYWRTGPASILLQTFTSDHELLFAALHKALPHFPPSGREYYSDFATLHQIAIDLGQFPGRKNILWFSGGSTLFLQPDPTVLQNTTDWRYVYDELEASRIAIYPIDARGLTLTEGYRIWAQHALMNDIAETTGGRAFYNNNGLDKTAAHWLDTSGSFYTLTYSPSNFRPDNKWHKVRVKLNGDAAAYTLSYRRGYFADATTGLRQPEGPRTVRLAGETVAEPDLRSAPIVFQALVLPASEAPHLPIPTGAAPSVNQTPPKKGTIPYTIRYSLPVDAFTPKMMEGKQEIEFGVAVFAFDQNGVIVARLGNRITFNVNQNRLNLTPPVRFPFDQQINLRKGQNYLYFAVWDMTSGRLGTLQIPFQAAAAPKSQKP